MFSNLAGACPGTPLPGLHSPHGVADTSRIVASWAYEAMPPFQAARLYQFPDGMTEALKTPCPAKGPQRLVLVHPSSCARFWHRRPQEPAPP